MNPKHFIPAILIFSAVFLSGFSVKSQSASDTIRAEKRGLRYIYYQVKEGVDVYNNAIKKSKNTSIDLGFSPGGVMFRLGF